MGRSDKDADAIRAETIREARGDSGQMLENRAEECERKSPTRSPTRKPSSRKTSPNSPASPAKRTTCWGTCRNEPDRLQRLAHELHLSDRADRRPGAAQYGVAVPVEDLPVEPEAPALRHGRQRRSGPISRCCCAISPGSYDPFGAAIRIDANAVPRPS